MAIDSGELDGKKPAAKPEETPTPEQTAEITIGGKKFVVNQQMAEAIRSEQDNFQGSNIQFQRELKERLDRLEGQLSKPAAKPADTTDDKVDFWENPERYFKALQDNIDKRIEERVSGVRDELTSSYQQEKKLEQFWIDFYKENKDLKDDDFIVKSVLQRDYAELSTIPLDQAQQKLAARSRDVLLKYTKAESPKPEDKVVVEGGPAAASKKPASGTDEPKILSLTDIVKQRREAKRKARAK